MIEISEAESADIDSLVELESALFIEDAGQHDPFTDPTWPAREGHKDLTALMASPDAIVLAARRDDEVTGLLVGYAQQASPTRQPVEFAVLRTLYVAGDARHQGIGRMLTERFLQWARSRGCAEAHVDHYAANSGAATFYERCGFEPRSVSRVIGL